MSLSNVLVVGSLVYDEIFTINGKIKNEIPLKNGKIEAINLMFTANNKKRMLGGTAGNIAYGLSLLGESPFVVSAVGDDFNHDYLPYLEKLKVKPRVFKGEKGTFSATFYGISDNDNQQIGIFQPNYYGEGIDNFMLKDVLSKKELEEVKIAIFAPGTGNSALRHIIEFSKNKSKEALIILDPGQELSSSFNKNLLNKILPKVDIFIGNQVEIDQLERLHGFKKDDLFALGVKTVIETLGEKGSVIYQKNKEMFVKAEKADFFKEATGAGDAFRAGLIKSLMEDKDDIKKACQLASQMGAKSVEVIGGQGYRI